MTNIDDLENRARSINFRDIPLELFEGIPLDLECPALVLGNNMRFSDVAYVEMITSLGSTHTGFSLGPTKDHTEIARLVLDLLRNVMRENKQPFTSPIPTYFTQEYKEVAKLLEENNKKLTITKTINVGFIDDPIGFMTCPKMPDYSLEHEDYQRVVDKFVKHYNRLKNTFIALRDKVLGRKICSPPYLALDVSPEKAEVAVHFGLTTATRDVEFIPRTELARGEYPVIAGELDKVLWSQHPIMPIPEYRQGRLFEPVEVVVTNNTDETQALFNELNKLGYEIKIFEMPDISVK